MPEYLKKRFGGVRIRRYMSILALIMYVLRNISVSFFGCQWVNIFCVQRTDLLEPRREKTGYLDMRKQRR